MLSNKYQITLN